MEEIDQPFSQADALELNKLNQSLASLRSQVSDGILYPEEAKGAQEGILADRNALLSRKQQAETAARGQMRMAQQDEMANQHMMGIANAKNMAENFASTMPIYTDPTTGKQTVFYPKGMYEPLQQDDPFDAILGSGDAGLDGMSADATGGEPMAQDAGSETPDAQPQAGPKDHTMTIYNGPNREDTIFRDGKAISQQRFDRQGMPAGNQSQPDAMFGLNPEAMREIDNLAAASAMHLPPGIQRNAHVAHVKQRLIMGKIQQAAMERRQKAAMEIQGKIAERQSHRENQAKLDTEYRSNVRHYFDSKQKEIDKLRETMTGEQIKAKYPENPELWDREAHRKWAEETAATVTGSGNPDWIPPGQKKAQSPEAQKKVQSQQGAMEYLTGLMEKMAQPPVRPRQPPAPAPETLPPGRPVGPGRPTPGLR